MSCRAYNTIQLLLVFEEKVPEENSLTSRLNAEKAPGVGSSRTKRHQKEEAPGGGGTTRKRLQEDTTRG